MIIYEERKEAIFPANDVYLKSGNGGPQFIITIVGSIYNVELVSVEWDDSTETIIEKAVIESYPKITDSSIHVPTHFPEGLPSEKVKWEDKDGNTAEIYIGYDGRQVSGTVTWFIE